MPKYWKYTVIKTTFLLTGVLWAMGYPTPAKLEIVLTAIRDELKQDLEVQHKYNYKVEKASVGIRV